MGGKAGAEGNPSRLEQEEGANGRSVWTASRHRAVLLTLLLPIVVRHRLPGCGLTEAFAAAQSATLRHIRLSALGTLSLYWNLLRWRRVIFREDQSWYRKLQVSVYGPRVVGVFADAREANPRARRTLSLPVLPATGGIMILSFETSPFSP